VILIWYPQDNKIKGVDMDYKTILESTRWFQAINIYSYQNISLDLLSYIFTDYYKDVKDGKLISDATELNAERIMAFNLIDTVISRMFYEVESLAQEEFVYGLKDYNTFIMNLLLKSEVHKDYVYHKNINNEGYCLLSDIKSIVDGAEYDDSMIIRHLCSSFEIRESPFYFDLDKLKSEAISHQRSSGYMERRYKSIASIIRFGLADEETFSFINENLTKKFRRKCFDLAFNTSKNIQKLIALKERDDSYSDYTFEELNIKLFFNNMIMYNTIKDLEYWDQLRYFRNNMKRNDIPHLTPLTKDFDPHSKKVFFGECDRIMRVTR